MARNSYGNNVTATTNVSGNRGDYVENYGGNGWGWGASNGGFVNGVGGRYEVGGGFNGQTGG